MNNWNCKKFCWTASGIHKWLMKKKWVPVRLGAPWWSGNEEEELPINGEKSWPSTPILLLLLLLNQQNLEWRWVFLLWIFCCKWTENEDEFLGFEKPILLLKFGRHQIFLWRHQIFLWWHQAFFFPFWKVGHPSWKVGILLKQKLNTSNFFCLFSYQKNFFYGFPHKELLGLTRIRFYFLILFWSLAHLIVIILISV